MGKVSATFLIQMCLFVDILSDWKNAARFSGKRLAQQCQCSKCQFSRLPLSA